MKRFPILVLSSFLLCGALAVAEAAQRGTPEYEKMKEYKKAQHDKKASGTAEKGFWEREGERSGLSGTAAMLGNAVSSVTPFEKPNSRKVAK